MKKTETLLLTLLLAAVATSLSCSNSEPPPQEPTQGTEPTQQTETALPPGHPAIQDPDTASRVRPPEPGTGTGAAALTWTTPTGWIDEEPSSRMRRAQYRVPGSGGEGGDAECVVFYFGPGQGGDATTNARRWANQFSQPDGRPSEEVMKTSLLEGGPVRILMVEVAGTYSAGLMAGGSAGEEKPDYMLLGAVAQGPDANWFFKLTGPEPTVREQRDAFEGMLLSLKAGA
jgi:hypothetical protein